MRDTASSIPAAYQRQNNETSVVVRAEINYQHWKDEELAQLVARGDKIALEILYQRYSRQAISLAYRIIGQAELAEEVAHELFLRFWEKPELYQPQRGRFAGWLLAAVHHRAINERRLSSFRLNVSIHPNEADPDGGEGWQGVLADDQPEPYEMVWQYEQQKDVRQALGKLSPPQRQALEMAYFKGLNQQEIAQELNQPLGTIKSRIRLGLQKMRTILSPAHSERDVLTEAE